VDGGDGDALVHDGVEIGAGIRKPGRWRSADPEVGDAARVEPLDELVRVDAAAEPGDLDPLACLGVDGGDVDVDELAARQPVVEDVPRATVVAASRQA
jgi:hypothetical protein